MSKSCPNRRKFLTHSALSLVTASVALDIGNLSAAADECAAKTKDIQAAITPDQALQKLKEGNARFVSGKMRGCDYKTQVRATATGQHPFAAIVGCIDSRVSNELVFDQGVGDIFSARVAGNFVNDDMLGSLEFACAVAGAKLVLVVGHTECGAIKGACDDVIFGNLTQTLANIKPAVAAVDGFENDRSSKNAEFVQAVADKNVELTLNRIRNRSAVLRGMVDKNEIRLVGAMYDVGTGQVRFI